MMPSPRFALSLTLVLVSCVLILGCSRETPESLHETDHFVAAHWPTSLADAASKMETRVVSLQTGRDEKTYAELCDIVGWIPEIAADSELSEADWIPINEASLAISNRLRNEAKQAITNLAADLQAFQDLIVRESDKLARTDRERRERATSTEMLP